MAAWLAVGGLVFAVGCGGAAVSLAPTIPTDAPTAGVTAGTATLAITGGSIPIAPTASAGTAAVPELPPSVGNAVIFHLQFATDIDGSGTPINQGTVFPVGTKTIFALLGWSAVEPGTELKLRLFQADRFVYETSHTVVKAEGSAEGTGVGFVYGFTTKSGFPEGRYSVEVDFNGVPDEVASFLVGEGAEQGQILGSGTGTGPIPYKDPAEVLIVTRAAVLREKLGADADAVLAAAAAVGDLHDLDDGGVVRSTPEAAAEEVHRLLRSGTYKYLLILGNDDTVPFFHVANPVGTDEEAALVDWQLPSDWLPSDDPYTDLDADSYGVPDLPTARIPSSDDAELLLTQLGTLVPPDGSAFALVNQERRSQAGAVVGTIDPNVQVELHYSPPVDAAEFAANTNAAGARYLYVLLHGIGVLTDAWSANTVVWEAGDPQKPLDSEWIVHESRQLDSVTIENNPGSRGVVQVGACYGAWTLDTIQEPQHKTAANSLALHYLKSGTRAFVADTHLSYSTLMLPTDVPRGRTGFEIIFWRGLNEGLAPIDAFFQAKVETAKAVDVLASAGRVDSAKITLKTVHYMIYLGRP